MSNLSQLKKVQTKYFSLKIPSNWTIKKDDCFPDAGCWLYKGTKEVAELNISGSYSGYKDADLEELKDNFIDHNAIIKSHYSTINKKKYIIRYLHLKYESTPVGYKGEKINSTATAYLYSSRKRPLVMALVFYDKRCSKAEINTVYKNFKACY